MKKPHRQKAVIGGPKIGIDDFEMRLPRLSPQRFEQNLAIGGYEIGHFQSTCAKFRQIAAKPIGQRGIQIYDFSIRIQR